MLLDQKSFGSDGSELPKNNRYPWITPCKAFNSPVFEQVFKKKPNYPSSMWNPFSFENQRRVFHNYYESAPLKFHFCISAIKGQTRKCDLFKRLRVHVPNHEIPEKNRAHIFLRKKIGHIFLGQKSQTKRSSSMNMLEGLKNFHWFSQLKSE